MKLKDIKGFEGLYAVTEDGHIYSYYKKELKSERLNKYGYYEVYLHVKGNRKKKKYKVHRLIYETFNGIIPEDLTVDHIDGDKHNNKLSNLQLLTREENSSKAAKGKSPWNKGKKFSDEHKRKLSEARKLDWVKRKLNA
ncbi:MAG: HNH endonuclease [Bacteroidales bacterium]|nr:HNH endonuclease [Bacteroidales bacterium]